MPQRAVDFGGEARERAEQRVAVEAVEHALPLALAGDQPGALSTDRWREIAGALMAKRSARSAVDSAVCDRNAMMLPARQRRQRVEHALQDVTSMLIS